MIEITDIFFIVGYIRQTTKQLIMSKERKRSLHITIYPSVLAKLQAIAASKNQSLSKTVADLIKKYEKEKMP